MTENIVVITFIVVVRDGEPFLPFLLEDILAQDFPAEKMEILLVDGQSRDDTQKIIQEFIDNNPAYKTKMLINEGRILSTGWNLALGEARGRAILRVDAHSRIPRNFISRNFECINSGESICGGYLKSLEPSGFWPKLAYLIDSSKFGGSPASFRNPGKSRYVDTIAYACYKEEVFASVGGFDERLIRNQDNEIHHRMRMAGFRFYYDPAIYSYYISRGSVKKLVKQKFLNGLWIGITLGVSPFCFRLRHFIPAAFFLSTIIATLFGYMNIGANWAFWPLFLLIFSYLSLAIYFSHGALEKEKGWHRLLIFILPFPFFVLHFAYGLGTILGVLYMPFYLLCHRNYVTKWPIRLNGN
jgi:glycosyltransferase involved in cell wall biosynthesis